MYYINPDGTVGTTEVRLGEDGHIESSDYSEFYLAWGTPTPPKKTSKSEWAKTGRIDVVPMSSKKKPKLKKIRINEENQVRSLLESWLSTYKDGLIETKVFFQEYYRCDLIMKVFLLVDMQRKGLSVKITQVDLPQIIKFYFGMDDRDSVLPLFKFDSEVVENEFVKMTEEYFK